MANASAIIDKTRRAVREAMTARTALRAVYDELQALGVDEVLGKLEWYDSEGDPIRDISIEEFKTALSSIEAFDEWMKLGHEAIFYRIAS